MTLCDQLARLLQQVVEKRGVDELLESLNLPFCVFRPIWAVIPA